MRITNLFKRFRHDDRGAVTEEYSFVAMISATIVAAIIAFLHSDVVQRLIESFITGVVNLLVRLVFGALG